MFSQSCSGLRACLAGLLLAYLIVFPAKWAGPMPARLTWPGLSIVPAAPFGLLGSLFEGPLLLGRRWPWSFLPAALARVLAMGAVIWLRAGVM